MPAELMPVEHSERNRDQAKHQQSSLRRSVAHEVAGVGEAVERTDREISTIGDQAESGEETQ